jgi:hypothetical protein
METHRGAQSEVHRWWTATAKGLSATQVSLMGPRLKRSSVGFPTSKHVRGRGLSCLLCIAPGVIAFVRSCAQDAGPKTPVTALPVYRGPLAA